MDIYVKMFIAHKNDIPKGTAIALDCFKKLKMASNTGREVRLLGNVCHHQYSIINSDVQQDELVCPYHGRTWDIDGSARPSCEYQSLFSDPTYNQCGLLFDSDIDFKSTFVIPEDMKLIEKRIDTVRASSDVIMDVFLDVEHIPHAHKDVYNSIGITDRFSVAWVMKEWGSIQLAIDDNKICAVWIAQYPGTMIEWQPGALFITQCIPSEDTKTTNVQVFQYKETKSTKEEFEENKKIWETAWEQDVNLAQNIVKRQPQHTGEPGKDHFREWRNGWS